MTNLKDIHTAPVEPAKREATAQTTTAIARTVTDMAELTQYELLLKDLHDNFHGGEINLVVERCPYCH